MAYAHQMRDRRKVAGEVRGKRGESKKMLANIEEERIRKGLTQKQFALQLGVSNKTYCDWINEKKDIPGKKLQKLSQMLDSSMEYLLGGEQKRVFYLCDGIVPTCKKNTCYKNPGKKNTCPPCNYTSDIKHALNFHKTSKHAHGAYYEKGQPE